jgi:hypothetical protein
LLPQNKTRTKVSAGAGKVNSIEAVSIIEERAGNNPLTWKWDADNAGLTWDKEANTVARAVWTLAESLPLGYAAIPEPNAKRWLR